jgi:signal transduction histidine kinase
VAISDDSITPGNIGSRENLAFTVDTHLLRELGALLVGRDSTALVELIKNAYDADATHVVVHGERLGNHGSISIRDDGNGMTYEDFVDKFLRIAGRSKEGGQRRSPTYGRKFTGAKGIGRLSAHKLGDTLSLESTPDLTVLNRMGSSAGFIASIDWGKIEASSESMDQTKVIEAQRVRAQGIDKVPSGTLMTINDLHSGWSRRQLNNFLSEVRSTRPDPTLTAPLPNDVLAGELLLPRIEIADSNGPEADPGFEIELSGEFADSEAQWPTLLAHINWILEIDARDTKVVIYRLTPAARTALVYPDSRSETFEFARSKAGPAFTARVFIRDGSVPTSSRMSDTLSTFAKEAAGVRLFFEGFRTLPYGTPRNDWLGLDRSYTARNALEGIDDLLSRSGRSELDERTYQLSNSSYFGAVFLQDESSGGLEMVVNREGFLPSEAFDQLTEDVRRGINISVRIRATHGARAKEAKTRKKSAERKAVVQRILDEALSRRDTDRAASRVGLDTWLEVGRDAAATLRASTSGGTGVVDKENIEIVAVALEEVQIARESATEEQAQLRVLASLGTQMGAFVHEVNGILGQAQVIEDLLTSLSKDMAGTSGALIKNVIRAQKELVTSLERQAIYLSDSLGAETGRKRSRQKLRERWITAERLLGGAAARRSVLIENSISPLLLSPPMFAAEMNVIFTNVLSNAIKAAAAESADPAPRVVRVRAESDESIVRIRIENTGARVDLPDSDRWFRAFETTTAEVDPVLGQGLGLGLPLTRRIIEEYDGAIHFATPSSDMATAIEIVLPSR